MCLISLFAMQGQLFAQSEDVTLEKVQEGHRTVIYARNVSEVTQLVELDLTVEYVKLNRALPVQDTLLPGERKKLIVLEPEPLEAWSYKTKYRSSPIDLATPPMREDELMTQSSSKENKGRIAFGPPLGPDDEPIPVRYLVNVEDSREMVLDSGETQRSESEIVVYGQPGCLRCKMAILLLDERDVKYRYIDISTNAEEEAKVQAAMFTQGFTGGLYTLPIISINSKLFYSIGDIEVFVQDHILPSED